MIHSNNLQRFVGLHLHISNGLVASALHHQLDEPF